MNKKKLAEIAEQLPDELHVTNKVAVEKIIRRKSSNYPERHWTSWTKNGAKETFLAVLGTGGVKLIPSQEVKEQYEIHNA